MILAEKRYKKKKYLSLEKLKRVFLEDFAIPNSVRENK